MSRLFAELVTPRGKSKGKEEQGQLAVLFFSVFVCVGWKSQHFPNRRLSTGFGIKALCRAHLEPGKGKAKTGKVPGKPVPRSFA